MKVNQFRSQIRKSIADEHLQKALADNAKRRRFGFNEAFLSFPNLLASKQNLHTIKAEVIQNLNANVLKFSARVEKNGIHVHYAKNADEAIKFVLEIANEHHAHLLAKS